LGGGAGGFLDIGKPGGVLGAEKLAFRTKLFRDPAFRFFYVALINHGDFFRGDRGGFVDILGIEILEFRF